MRKKKQKKYGREDRLLDMTVLASQRSNTNCEQKLWTGERLHRIKLEDGIKLEDTQWEDEIDIKKKKEVALGAASGPERLQFWFQLPSVSILPVKAPFLKENSMSQFFATRRPFLEGSALKTFFRKWRLSCIVPFFVSGESQLQIPGSQAFTFTTLWLSRLPQRSLYFPCFWDRRNFSCSATT